jgi:2-isopropylmalate synthase
MTSASPANDKAIKALADSGAGVVTIFGKSWDLHVKDVLKVSLDENLRMISETVDYLKAKGFRVFYDAEHFFDGYKANPAYALSTLKAASKADVIVLCDTNGGTMPWETDAITKDVFAKIRKPFGIHAHNDSGFAVMNSLIALKNGATHAQGTMNGLGERCGNLDWCEFLPVVSIKMGMKLGIDLSRLLEFSTYVQRLTGISLPKNKPFVGESAFSHKGGVHIDAIIKNPKSYEHVDPEMVGNKRLFILSEQAGRSAIVESARRHGYALGKNDPVVLEIMESMKEKQKFSDAELFLLLAKKIDGKQSPFELVGYETEVRSTGNAKTEIKVRIGKETLHEIAEGVGPVHSLDMALRKALENFYDMRNVSLSNYRVRIINQEKATAAKVEVFIEFKANGDSWSASDVSDDVIKASENALVKGYKYYLLKSGTLKSAGRRYGAYPSALSVAKHD